MAGTAGPCPSCHAQIRAPAPAVELPPEGRPRTGFKVEPRNSRPRLADVVSRPMADSEYLDSPPPSKFLTSRVQNGSRFLSILIGCAVLAIMIGVPIGLHSYMKKGIKNLPKDNSGAVARILPEEAELTGDVPGISEIAPEGASGAFEKATAAPTGIDSDPADAAKKTLVAFLAATTLAERLPLIETKLKESELAASILSSEFPPSARVLRDVQVTNSRSHIADTFFSVDFSANSEKPNFYSILVRTRQGAEPKVVVDPFLDSFGGRLADYAAAPSDNPASFQVIVTAVARCFDQSVPNHEEKLTLKLLSHDNQKEIARAYFNKHSTIGEMLQDDSFGFRYGQARPCKVFLKWNTRENSGMPFLEAVSLTDFGWNP